MKKIFLLLPALLTTMLVGCGKYASQKQALVACQEWKAKGDRIDFIRNFGDKDEREDYVTDRTCIIEEVTNQFLGSQGEFSHWDRKLEGENIDYQKVPKPKNLKVVKNFYY